MTITIKNLTIQFDAEQTTSGTPLEQARQAIEQINLALQREPYGLGAQIFESGIDISDIETQESEIEEELPK
jgi:hypothetical protein